MTTAELPVAQFRASLRGQLIEPHDADYQTARSVYNGMIDKCPALIARCATGSDVMASVNFAREHDLLVAVKGGGHNGAGLGVCQDGLVIDLSPMKHIEVNPAERTVRVQGGCLLRELDAATHAHGLAVPTGINGTTGVAGLTLGGGLGYLTRIELHIKYGEALPSMLPTMHLYPIDGAASRVSNEVTAWGYRDATWAMVIAGIDADPANKDTITNWARDYWQDLHPHSAGGSYINFMMDEGQDRVRATYGGNYPRLAAIKAKYDPDNLFRVNQNIQPQLS